MSNLWDYPGVGYDDDSRRRSHYKIKQLVKEGKIKSRLVELDSFYVFKLEMKMIDEILEVKTNLHKLYKVYIIAFYDYPTDKKLIKEIVNYLNAHPGTIEHTEKYDMDVLYSMVVNHYYFDKYKDDLTEIENIIVKYKDKYSFYELYDLLGYYLVDKGKSTDELVDLVEKYNPEYLSNTSGYISDEMFIEKLSGITDGESVILIIESAYEHGVDRLIHILNLYKKIGVDLKYLFCTYISNSYEFAIDNDIIEQMIKIGGVKLGELYNEISDVGVKGYIGNIILNQI